MGGFCYLEKSRDVSADAALRAHARSLQALERKGFPDSRALTRKEIIERDDFVICVYEKIGCRTESVLHLEAGDFILATGTLIYKKQTGSAALRELFHDFDPAGNFFNELRGHFCVLVCKQSSLHVFNDYFGVYQVFADAGHGVISSSFLAVVRSLDTRVISRQGLYEYLSDGASYAGETYVKGVNVLDAFSVHQLTPGYRRVDKAYVPPDIDAGGFDGRVDAMLERLTGYFHDLKHCFGADATIGLSGGYDSRLILALLMQAGMHPHVYVYGGGGSRDVKIALAIGKGEGIAIHHDARQDPACDIDTFVEATRLEYFYCDGRGPNGAFTNGREMAARVLRSGASRLQLNGGGGEIFRNFWKLPERPLAIRDFLKSRFDFLTRGTFTSRFDKDEYFQHLAVKVQRMLRTREERLTRQEIEMLYVYMRVRYWMGHNTSIQNLRGFALIPLTEPCFAFPSWQIPVGEKDLGRFEAALIRRLNPRLAAYPSAYGFNFADDIPLSARIREVLLVNVPVAMRPPLRKLKQHLVHHRPRPFFLQQKYVGAVLGSRDACAAEFVNLDRVHDPLMLSRAYTVDLVMADPF